MATFGALVQDRIGTFSNTDLIDHTLTEGARIIVDKLADEKDSRLDLYATDKADSGTGVDVTGGRVIKAHKSNYIAQKVDAANSARYVLTGSIYKATATDPIWYLFKSEAFIIPSGGTAQWVAYPTVANSDSAISNFPPQGYPSVVLYSAVNCQLSIISTLIVTTMAGEVFVNPSNVSPPSAPSFTWTDATGTTIDLSTISISKTLTFSPPVFGGSYTDITTRLGNSDLEWTKGEGVKLDVQLKQYQTDLENALSAFNKESKQYDNELQEVIAQASIDAQRASAQGALTQDLKLQNEINDYRQDVEEYQAKLGKYQTDVQDFTAQVNESAQDLSLETQKNSSMLQGHLALADKLKQEYVEALGIL